MYVDCQSVEKHYLCPPKLRHMENQGEIILYQPDNEVKLEVRLEEETVWLTQAQMAELFQTSKQNVSLHTNNIFKEKELSPDSVIISVGYRVKSIRGTQFRQWANKVLKEYLLKGYSVNQHLSNLEDRMNSKFMEHEQRLNRIDSKIDFFVRTSLPPVEGIFYDGQLFDAYKFATDLIRSAKVSLLLIDNYVDESVLLMLSKRDAGVKADIYTQAVSHQLQLDIQKHNSQYPPIGIHTYKKCHDRFLIIDGTDIYHIGASLKDLGKKMFAFSKLEIPATSITDLL